MIQGRLKNQASSFLLNYNKLIQILFFGFLTTTAYGSETDLRDFANSYSKSTSIENQLRSLSLKAVEKFAEEKAEEQTECVEVKKTKNSGRFVTSFDANGKACAVYDLSFPTLTSFFGSQKLNSIPIQKFSMRDYWDWLNGRYDKVLKKFDLNRTVSDQEALNQFWNDPELNDGSPLPITQNAMASEFYLSEIVPVGTFTWSPQQKSLLQRVRRRARGQIDPVTDMAINNPQSLLSKIKLKWDSGRKVYDVFMDFDFLPLSGPVVLVDFNQHYKLPLQSIIRSVTQYALFNVAEFIPRKLVKRIVQVAIEDAFDAVDQLYNFQLVKLEETLDANIKGKMKTSIPSQHLDRSLNLVYAQKGDAISQFLISQIQGQEISLDDLEYLGEQTRHTQEKMRRSMLLNNYSELSTEMNCDPEIVLDSYAVCHQNGEKKAIYSLMSRSSVGPVDLGPTMIFDYGFKGRMVAQRSLSWLLSVGIRIWSPLGRSISFTIGNVFKDFSQVGLTDESIFMQRLENGETDPRFTNILVDNEEFWMNIQNINPFIPKSKSTSQRLIQYHENKLNLRISENLAEQ